jgi:membrane protein
MRLRAPDGRRLAALRAYLKPRAQAFGGFVTLAAERFWQDRCTQAAAALTYTSLLSLVPLMAVSIGILSAFPAFGDVQDRLQGIIFNTLVPEVGDAVLDYVNDFVSRTGSMTAVGVIGLMIAALLLLATIEESFNTIWHVTRVRSLLVRLLSFWAILTLTPLLFGASLSLTGQYLDPDTLAGQVPLWRQAVGILPLLFELLGFAVLYWLIPNRPVRLRDAAVGAAVAAVLFEISKAGFALYIAWFPLYETVYGAVSLIPIFLIWLYLAWSVVLLGAVVAATLPDWRTARLTGKRSPGMRPAQRVALAVGLLRELHRARGSGREVSRRRLLDALPVSGPMIDDLLDALRRHRYVVRTSADRWVLSRDLSAVTLYDLAAALGATLREQEDRPVGAIRRLEGDWLGRVLELLQQADGAQRKVFSPCLAELVSDGDRPGLAALPDQRAGAAE